MQSEAKQNILKLAFGVHCAPVPAPAKLLRHVASIQLIACDAFRYGDLSMTRVHVGLPKMACIPIRHRDAIAREVVAALACIAMETKA